MLAGGVVGSSSGLATLRSSASPVAVVAVVQESDRVDLDKVRRQTREGSRQTREGREEEHSALHDTGRRAHERSATRSLLLYQRRVCVVVVVVGAEGLTRTHRTKRRVLAAVWHMSGRRQHHAAHQGSA